METITLPSNAQLSLCDIPFSQANALKKAVLNELATAKVNLEGVAKIEDLKNIDAGQFLSLLAKVVASDAVEMRLMACMGRCLYNGEKITADTFEPASAREDFTLCAWEVAKYSLLPFFKSLGSLFKGSVAAQPSGQT